MADVDALAVGELSPAKVIARQGAAVYNLALVLEHVLTGDYGETPDALVDMVREVGDRR